MQDTQMVFCIIDRTITLSVEHYDIGMKNVSQGLKSVHI